ncbi:MAG: hypothetical protein M3Q78_09620, partial [Acidobacteriota bacterium]|nr:hypothetical protein [Acidobacteriota bacterium]
VPVGDFPFTAAIGDFNADAGLGAGVGNSVVFVFNCGNLNMIHGTVIEDWALNVSAIGKATAICKFFMNMKLWATVAKIAKAAKATAEDVDRLRLAANYLYNCFDLQGKDTGPKIFALDSPYGVGVELSLVALAGYFYLGDMNTK